MEKKSDRRTPTDYERKEGQRIKIYRESLGKTQEEFAEIIGKSIAMVGRYERGESQMPDEVKDFLTREYDMSTTYIITGEMNDYIIELENRISKVPSKHLEIILDVILGEMKRRREGVKD